MNRIQSVLEQDHKLLSIYFTAGFPQLEDTVGILKQLEDSGVDMIELGLPFSDPFGRRTNHPRKLYTSPEKRHDNRQAI
jgi:tryptophan synthase alpha subunit